MSDAQVVSEIRAKRVFIVKSTLLFLIAAFPLFAQPSKKLSEQPYNMVQMKTSHNSEQREETLPKSLECDLKVPWQSCCLGIEFDLSQDEEYSGPDDYWQWSIAHSTDYDWKAATLYSDLMILRNWHNANKDHNVVTIFLDPKNAFGKPGGFITNLDNQLKATLGEENIYKPGDLQVDKQHTLLASAKEGWPAMAELKNKFIVVITGTDKPVPKPKDQDKPVDVADFREAYAQPAVHKAIPTDAMSYTRMAFVDVDLSPGSPSQLSKSNDDGNRVFANIKYGADWCDLVKQARSAGYVTRVWVENDSDSWNDVLQAGVNLLATNMIRDKDFASVEGQYRKVPVIPACPR